jgi:hypothetical protein
MLRTILLICRITQWLAYTVAIEMTHAASVPLDRQAAVADSLVSLYQLLEMPFAVAFGPRFAKSGGVATQLS